VGYHDLTGAKVTLKKPLLVLRKKKPSGSNQEPPTTAADVELEVIGVIRQNILMKDRPKALISSNHFSFHFHWLPSPPFTNRRVFGQMLLAEKMKGKCKNNFKVGCFLGIMIVGTLKGWSPELASFLNVGESWSDEWLH
jgi:hypothetical protein